MPPFVLSVKDPGFLPLRNGIAESQLLRNRQKWSCQLMVPYSKLVVVGGCGHVGIPLGLAFASRDFTVTLLDCNARNVDLLNRGELPFLERGGEEILRDHIHRNVRGLL